MHALATDVLAVACPVLTVGRGVPQAVRLARRGGEGVSILTWQLWLLVGEPWIAYGVVAHVPAEVVTNAAASVVSLVTLVLAGRRARTTGRVLATAGGGTAAIALLVAGSVATHDLAPISLVAVAGSLGVYIPQAVGTFRAPSVAGVSVPTWALTLVNSLAWGAYGLLISKAPVWIPSVVAVPTTAVIVLRLYTRRAGSPDRIVASASSAT